jgi:hypothetical protein
MFLGYIAIAIPCLWFSRQAFAGFQQVELFKCHVKEEQEESGMIWNV